MRQKRLTHGSLFSGIGGFDLAAEWMGWENVLHCEINPFCQKILKHYWPNSKSYEDIKKTDFTPHRGSIDILTGGFPCQPYSTAGKRLGKEDERHLWPEMLRSIRELQPTWVVGENVFGIVNWSGGVVFEEVQTDLEAEGYEVQPYVLPASGKNAPHKRDRVWFVGYSASNRRKWSGQEFEDENGEQRPGKTSIMERGFKGLCALGDATDTTISRSQERKQNGGWENTEKNRRGMDNRFERLSNIWTTANTSNEQLQGSKLYGSITVKGKIEKKSRQFSRSVCSHWEQFPTQSPICSRDDGLSSGLDGITFSKWRNESIKGYGNAIVPQVVFEIFRSIQEYEDLISNQ